MKLDLIRHQFGKDATNGMLFINGVFECYTLEDEVRDVKVFGETAIPEGTYPIAFRKEGGFHQRYSDRYKNAHYGMLEIKEIPNFMFVLFHAGNTDENTAGCILVGDTQQDLDVSQDGFIGSSRNAYKKMYNKIAIPMLNGEKVSLTISSINVDKPKTISNKTTDSVVNIAQINDQQNELKKEFEKINGKLALILAKVSGFNIT